MYTVTIDEDKCQGCSECADNCPAGILSLDGGKAKVTGDMAECLGCETCSSSCEHGAVTVSED